MKITKQKKTANKLISSCSALLSEMVTKIEYTYQIAGMSNELDFERLKHNIALLRYQLINNKEATRLDLIGKTYLGVLNIIDAPTKVLHVDDNDGKLNDLISILSQITEDTRAKMITEITLYDTTGGLKS